MQDFKFYVSILIPHLLNNQTDRVIYVDADVICLKSFDYLYELDLKDKIICASLDYNFKKYSDLIIWPYQRPIIENHFDFDLDRNSPYFNSGILVIDVKKWISANISQRVVEITYKYEKHVVFWDQYGLNIALNGKWLCLNSKFNCISKADKDTIFRHYAGHKPTSFDYPNSDKRLFYKYLRKTFYKNWRPINPYSFIYRISKRIVKYYKSLKTRIHTILILLKWKLLH